MWVSVAYSDPSKLSHRRNRMTPKWHYLSARNPWWIAAIRMHLEVIYTFVIGGVAWHEREIISLRQQHDSILRNLIWINKKTIINAPKQLVVDVVVAIVSPTQSTDGSRGIIYCCCCFGFTFDMLGEYAIFVYFLCNFNLRIHVINICGITVCRQARYTAYKDRNLRNDQKPHIWQEFSDK